MEGGREEGREGGREGGVRTNRGDLPPVQELPSSFRLAYSASCGEEGGRQGGREEGMWLERGWRDE